VGVGVAGLLEGEHRDVVDPQVVGVRVAALVVAVGHDHLRALATDDLDQPADGLVERGVGEGVGVGVGRRVGHARVAVAQQHDLVVADDLGGPLELPQADGGQVGHDVGLVHGGVEDVARLAAGAGDEHGTDALGVVPGDRAGPLGRLVVRVGVHGHQAERGVGHRRSRYRPSPGGPTRNWNAHRRPGGNARQ
jgi:hypothetical protein